MAYKILTSEAAANTTPSQFANNRVVRLVSTAAAARTITVFESPINQLSLTINATANATTLLTLTSGNTANIVVGQRIFGSTNTGVVNTLVASEVATIVSPTSIASNVAVIIANGVCQISTATSTKTLSILPNTELVIEKGRNSFLQSNNNTEILAVAVDQRG